MLYFRCSHYGTVRRCICLINTALLKGSITAAGYTQEQFAKILGISAQSLNYKLNNTREFKVSEIMKICDILNIINKDDYFFVQSVDKKSTDPKSA